MERTTQLWECCGSTVWCDEGPGFHLSSKTNSDFGSFKGAFRAIETWASSDLYFAMAARDVLFVVGWAGMPILHLQFLTRPDGRCRPENHPSLRSESQVIKK